MKTDDEAAAAPPVDALAAEHARNIADHDAKAAILADRRRAVAEHEVQLADARADAHATAQRLGEGGDVTALEIDDTSLEIAQLSIKLEMHRQAAGRAESETAKAAKAVLNTKFRLAEREARRLRGPEGEKQIAVGEAARAWRKAIDECRDATQQQLDAEGEVEHLRFELLGTNPLSKPFVTKTNEVALSTLALSAPGDVLVALIENRAASVDYVKLGESNLARAKSAQ